MDESVRVVVKTQSGRVIEEFAVPVETQGVYCGTYTWVDFDQLPPLSHGDSVSLSLAYSGDTQAQVLLALAEATEEQTDAIKEQTGALERIVSVLEEALPWIGRSNAE